LEAGLAANPKSAILADWHVLQERNKISNLGRFGFSNPPQNEFRTRNQQQHTPGRHLATPESDFQASGHGGKCPCYADTQLPPKSSLPPIERFSLNNGEGLGIEASVNCLARSDTSFCCGCAIVGSTFADDSIKQLTTPE
jgi:hypothetical protein